MTLPIVLTIAGSDSSGGAGIQADLKVFATLRVYGASVIAALTAQNTEGVRDAIGIDPAFVTAQIEAVSDDLDVAAVKTGMLYDAEIVESVSDSLKSFAIENLVVDPVMVSTSGHRLLSSNGVEKIKCKLLPMAKVVTPNAPEAFDLTGIEIVDVDSMKEAAKVIADFGAEAVIIKGGHLPNADKAIDVLYYAGDFTIHERPWIDTPHTHGSGCVFSAALTAHLAKGSTIMDAFLAAEDFIHTAIESAWKVGRGGKSPVNHLGVKE